MALAQVILTSGRSIELSTVRLSSTYGRMLEGYPFQRWNDRILEGLVKRTEKEHPSIPVHLVPPTREHPDVTAGSFGLVELLPSVTCVASFSSHPIDPERDSVSYYSALTVIWFQATPDIPQGEDADNGLRGIAWDDIAKDFEL